jgi:hypothetical protein
MEDNDPTTVFLHCKDCFTSGREDKIAVRVLDGPLLRLLQVICENHDDPKLVWATTIPLENFKTWPLPREERKI